jgi:hypothetical protein
MLIPAAIRCKLQINFGVPLTARRLRAHTLFIYANSRSEQERERAGSLTPERSAAAAADSATGCCHKRQEVHNYTCRAAPTGVANRGKSRQSAKQHLRRPRNSAAAAVVPRLQ